jgi:orotate phosphoribosyltransferase
LSAEARALVAHLREHALRTDGPFTLRSGAEVSWYLDARQTTFDGAGAKLVGAAVLAHIGDVDAVGGLTMGADPVAVATAIAGAARGRSLRAFSIRKQAKDHGTGGRLVGPVGSGDRVAMLEDTTTTGGAFFEAIDVAVSEGLDIVQAVVLVDRSGGAVAERMAERGIPYSVVVPLDDLGVTP